MKISKKVLICFCFMVLIILCKNTSYAGTQKLNSINYHAKLNSDGTMDVVETWDIYISETNTLFKDFKIDKLKFSEITDVYVTDLDRNIVLQKIDEEMYHVTNDCYYGLQVENSMGNVFEIAWGVGLDNSSDTRKYALSYKVHDVVTVYNDCSELYWQFIGKDNGIPANRVSGKIILPQPVNNFENLRVWAHGPLAGEIQKESNDTVVFNVENLEPQTMVETRIVTDENIFPDCTKKALSNKLDSILKEEQKWADEANFERRKARLIFIAIAIVYLLIFVFFLKKIIKYSRDLKKFKEENPNSKINVGEYFRDIPRQKDSTPAQAVYLFNSGSITNGAAVFSATILQLCLKKYFSIEKEGKEITFNFNKEKSLDELKEDEKIVLNLLYKAAGTSANSLTMTKLKKYARTEYDSFDSKINKLKKETKDYLVKNGSVNLENEKIRGKYKTKIMFYSMGLFFGVGMLFIFLPIFIEFIIIIALIYKILKEVPLLTEQGEKEHQQWKGLRKYMRDFSMLNERDIPDLILWEKYLVYATAFGISDKVIKQLRAMYPNFDNMDSSNYAYMYLMSSSNFGQDFINDFNHATQNVYSSYKSAYSAAHSSDSSGSGGGGGFSGGGGGRRWWRPEWAEDRL